MTGLELIAAERRRQIEQEGWTAEHDEQHEVDHLAAAAAAYILAEGLDAEMPKGWPWGRKWWKPKDRLRNLVRAGALYLAAADLAMKRGMPDREASLCELADLCANKIDEFTGVVLENTNVRIPPFQFHEDNPGHTVVIGPSGSGMSVIWPHDRKRLAPASTHADRADG